MILWAIIENGQWKVGIGDPTLGGWLTVLAYLITSLICFICGWKIKYFSYKIKQYQWFWWSLAIILLVLGINKQLDLQSWLTSVGKSLAIAQGWYERRRIIQGCFIAAIAITFLSLSMFLFQAMGQDWKRFRLAIFGLFFLLGFILIRALSFHHIDRLINWELSGFRMNWILELTGIICIGISAINYINKLKNYIKKVKFMIDEGYIKYQCNWIKTDPIASEKIQELNRWRNKLYNLGLIGQYENGIGYGNVSLRDGESNQFIVSGTQTGGMISLTDQHYTIVTDYNWSENYLTCQGSIQASSEALTHAAIYEANPKVNAVFHVHHRQLWQTLMNQVPTTRNEAAYGTPEMAREIIRLCQENTLQIPQILVMSGHEEGIIAFGSNLDEAGIYYCSI